MPQDYKSAEYKALKKESIRRAIEQGKFRCEICNVNLKDTYALKRHYGTKKHQRIQEANEVQEANEANEVQT